MSSRRLPVVVVFLVGCLAGGLGAQLAAPLVHAEAQPLAPPVQRWEHYCEAYTVNGAKVAGERGWEMVGLTSQVLSASENGNIMGGHTNGSTTYYTTTLACYKRPLAAGAPAAAPAPAAAAPAPTPAAK